MVFPPELKTLFVFCKNIWNYLYFACCHDVCIRYPTCYQFYRSNVVSKREYQPLFCSVAVADGSVIMQAVAEAVDSWFMAGLGGKAGARHATTSCLLCCIYHLSHSLLSTLSPTLYSSLPGIKVLNYAGRPWNDGKRFILVSHILVGLRCLHSVNNRRG